ncbi:MAG: sulfate reduction electron transfer complex DsrMKJOP subunit DsrO [Candidatus Kapaibacteriota bacterium]|jgi:molybdopterin-containing oxidoreductase family iron-sulfur binding subunit
MIDRRNFLKIVSFGGGIYLASKWTSNLISQNETQKVPQSGLTAKRWAMAIDVQKCEQTPNCKECILACHSYHNVPEFNNPKDEIKWIWKDKFHNAFITQENQYLPKGLNHQTVLLLCNHCDNPPCTNVCPTKATWKREDGIVMMDWHRCIGCRYCVAACPYGSRSFNWRDPRPFIKKINPEFPTRTRGVVEKCTFCAERLARGEMPACVEACPSKALIFGDLEDPGSEIRQILAERFSIRRKPELSTSPEVYYLV